MKNCSILNGRVFVMYNEFLDDLKGQIEKKKEHCNIFTFMMMWVIGWADPFESHLMYGETFNDRPATLPRLKL